MYRHLPEARGHGYGGDHEGPPQPRRHQDGGGGRPGQGREGGPHLPDQRGVPGGNLPSRGLSGTRTFMNNDPENKRLV